MLKLEYIDAYVEAMSEARRMAKKVDGLVSAGGTSFRTFSEFRKAATLTSSHIKRYQYDDFAVLSFLYRGHEFVHVAKPNEEQEVA